MLYKSDNEIKNVYFGQSPIYRIYLGSLNNLLRNSNKEISKDSYLLAKYNLTESLQIGETYTLTIWGENGNGKWWAIACNSGLNGISYNFKQIAPGIYTGTIIWPSYATENSLSIYHAPSSVTTISTIYKVKLEKGVNPTPIWTPAINEASIDYCAVYLNN